ncbi:hypothetical protein SAY86_009142 [Trapa natans]|uniref:HORMA domain-containing protein n=1 Tax=Trapa natans TaxID=22666 RepID=A0AAN7KAJ1_TRANT|nr:hypothetical protein SAY86_009142 [Trapa natans]
MKFRFYFEFKAEAEVKRLDQLKASKMKELLIKKQNELEEICSKSHMEVPSMTETDSILCLPLPPHHLLSRQAPTALASPRIKSAHLYGSAPHFPLLLRHSAMVVAQKVKEAEITEQDSLLLTRNLLRIAIFNISYIRGLFPEKYFTDKSVPALEMKIKKLMPMDAESRRLIDWMEKGVYDALQKKYLKTLLFCVCEALEGSMIEEYSFSFSYSSSDSQEVLMNVNRTGNKKGGAFKCNSTEEITPNQMRSSACKMVRTLVQLMRTLDKMPEERTILMKLLYYDDVTPTDYEPPFFRGCTNEEAYNPWTKSPLKMEVGNVNSKHFILALKVKSVLDPCEDENEDSEDDEVSLGNDSAQRDEDSDSDIEVDHSPGDQYVLVPIDKKMQDDNCAIDEDDTQDPVEDEHQFGRVKEWITSHHLGSFKLADVLSNFTDISVELTEEIMDRLVVEGVISKTGKDSYTVNNQKVKAGCQTDYDFPDVKVEIENQGLQGGETAPQVDDYMYMKALYHVLPMNYVTIGKLQTKLEGEANQSTVKKLIARMVYDGLLEGKSNKRLGKRVIHSNLTDKRLAEAKKVLQQNESMIFSGLLTHDLKGLLDFILTKYRSTGNHQQDMSTCGALQSIGSDLTRTRVRSDVNPNTSILSEQTTPRTNGHESTPISRAKPVASRESVVPGSKVGATRGTPNGEEDDTVICSRTSQEKRQRKTSTVVLKCSFEIRVRLRSPSSSIRSVRSLKLLEKPRQLFEVLLAQSENDWHLLYVKSEIHGLVIKENTNVKSGAIGRPIIPSNLFEKISGHSGPLVLFDPVINAPSGRPEDDKWDRPS